MQSDDLLLNRRRLFALLAGSPLMLGEDGTKPIASPEDAINVMDFEAAARQALPPAHFGYMATGVDGDVTLRANREGFNRIQLRPRRLIDVTKADLSVEIFGTRWETPIGFAPIGNQKAFHPEAELAVARAARTKNVLQILSTAANTSVEQVNDTLGRPTWYQLYPTSKWENTEKIVKRVEAAKCPVLVLTCDTQAGRFIETFERFKRLDSRQCTACHGTGPGEFYKRKPMFNGLDVIGVSTTNPAMTWEHVRRLKNMTSMKLMIKGIETRQDAELCVEHGVDGIVVSNHGGRAEESGRGTIECLPEVLEGVAGRIPVMIDGGFRRGTDIFKALAMGARAVFVGRPYIWALAAFGQPGIERVADMLHKELELVMKQCGTRSIKEVTRDHIMFRSA